MRSPWLVAVVTAIAGGAAGGALVWWRLAPAAQEGASPSAPGSDVISEVVRRLDRLEERAARVVQPGPTILRGAPEAAAVPREAAKEADQARWAGIAAAVEELKARVAGIAAVQEALAQEAGLPPPWPSDPAEVERIRDRWRVKLEELGKALWAAYPEGPDSRGDPVVWSRFDDYRKAKAAFDAATDAAALRALSEGEFRRYFTVKR